MKLITPLIMGLAVGQRISLCPVRPQCPPPRFVISRDPSAEVKHSDVNDDPAINTAECSTNKVLNHCIQIIYSFKIKVLNRTSPTDIRQPTLIQLHIAILDRITCLLSANSTGDNKVS